MSKHREMVSGDMSDESPRPIRIPLRPTDADVTLPLQTLLTAAFVNGRYQDELDYTQPLDPDLSLAADAAWADRLLRDLGCR